MRMRERMRERERKRWIDRERERKSEWDNCVTCNILSPKNSSQYLAILACCLGLQWFSKLRMSGYSLALKAYTEMTWSTSRAVRLVTRV